MPKRKRAWASWIYQSDTRADQSASLSLTYWMNNLQSLSTEQPLFVSLNPSREPAPDKVYNRHQFSHPKFDQAAIDAQQRLGKLQGMNRTWYCGAWQGYGFHEDGLYSAVQVAQRLGVSPPWDTVSSS